MILADLDCGGSHPWPAPVTGQTIGTALIVGSRTVVYPLGAGGTSSSNAGESQDVIFGVSAWQALGGQSAGSFLALRYQLRQLEELAANPDYQPVFIQWAATQQAGQYNVSEPRDGWYVIQSLEPNYQKNVVAGFVTCRMRVARIASALVPAAGAAAPASMGVSYAGAALSSGYSAGATPLIAFPLGSTGQPPTTGSRAGGEGSIPLSTSPVPNPLPFVPGSAAQLYDGGIRVLDTVNTGSNPVPVAGGTFLNANWVQVYGTNHDFVGDVVVTNGLLLLLFQIGQAHAASIYLWNTSLGTPTWQLQGTLDYADNAANAGTLRSIDLDKISMEEVRLRLQLSTSSGNWDLLKLRLERGCYHVYAEHWPMTESETNQLSLALTASSAYATAFTEGSSTGGFPANLTPTATSGYGAVQGAASGSPILGWLFQNVPTTAQGRASSSTVFGYGDSVGPTVGNFKLYGFFAVPYSGAVVLATARGIVAPLFAQFLFDRTTTWVRG